MTKRPWAIIAGGGTAGHVLPALAVGEALVARGVARDQLLFVGSRRGIERTLVPEAGFPALLLSGRGIQRRLTPANVPAALGLIAGFGRALITVLTKRPAVVLSVGGYASVPITAAAALLRVPIVVHEQNAHPGVANRFSGRSAKVCAITFAGTPLPRTVLTGIPVRPEFLALMASDRAEARAAARAELGIAPDRTVVVAFGGSLGARRINLAVEAATGIWRSRSDLYVHHIVGERDADRSLAAQAPLDGSDGIERRVVRYERRMPLVMAAADLVVCRAGSSSIADLSAAGLPAVLIPLPSAAEDHQTANARTVVEEGAGVMIPDADLDGPRLAEAVDALERDPLRLAAMSAAALRRARPTAAFDVADLLERHASRPVPGVAS